MAAMPSRRLYLHIGLQKTGTSYLQSIMWRNQELLRELGLDLVPPSKRETFHLMLNVRDRYRPEFDPPAAASALQRLPGQLASASRPKALISEESLAPASDPQIRDLLVACAERDVHLIVTLRDLGRQIPSAWQQTLQAGQSLPYAEYLRRLRKNEDTGSAKLWGSKDVAGILERWSGHVPADRIHLVTVPPQGSPQGLLLERYCRVLGVDPERLDRDVERSNESVGRIQAELLRRVNARLAPEFRTRDVYGDIGKRYLAVRVLGPQGGDKLRVPREHEEWCRDVSQRYVDAIVKGGYPVEGDVLDLVPTASSFADEPRVTNRQVADASVAALTTMVTDDMTSLRARRAKQRRRGRRTLRAVGRMSNRLFRRDRIK
jgi:hypothetical protein